MSTALDPVVRELRAQGWVVELGGDGKWKATPDDKRRRIVYFSARLTDAAPAIRELRQQGFQWPTPAPPEPVISSTPFPPKPHPLVSVVRQGVDEKPAPSSPRPAPSAERAFVELRDAKEYERLAAGELQEATKAAEAAIAKREEAATTYQGALEALAAKKRAFDQAFEGELEVETGRVAGGRS